MISKKILAAILTVALAVATTAEDEEVGISEDYNGIPYSFSYSFSDGESQQYRDEIGNGHSNVKGTYGFSDIRGIRRHVDYVADNSGYRAYIRTNEPGMANDNPASVHIDSEAPPNIPVQNGIGSTGDGQTSKNYDDDAFSEVYRENHQRLTNGQDPGNGARPRGLIVYDEHNRDAYDKSIYPNDASKPYVLNGKQSGQGDFHGHPHGDLPSANYEQNGAGRKGKDGRGSDSQRYGSKDESGGYLLDRDDASSVGGQTTHTRSNEVRRNRGHFGEDYSNDRIPNSIPPKTDDYLVKIFAGNTKELRNGFSQGYSHEDNGHTAGGHTHSSINKSDYSSVANGDGHRHHGRYFDRETRGAPQGDSSFANGRVAVNDYDDDHVHRGYAGSSGRYINGDLGGRESANGFDDGFHKGGHEHPDEVHAYQNGRSNASGFNGRSIGGKGGVRPFESGYGKRQSKYTAEDRHSATESDYSKV